MSFLARAFKTLRFPAVTLGIGALLTALLWFQTEHSLKLMKDREVELLQSRATASADDIERNASILHHGLRTFARLPGVRNLLSGGGLSADAEVSIQENYNGLATSVALSEVYLVPLGLDPDAGAVREPLRTFDKVIAGRTSESAAGEKSAVPQVEEFEYRAMRDQIARFRTSAAVLGADALAVPMDVSPLLITCDNSRIRSDRILDEDRSGFVLSVPCHAEGARLIGMVSGVILQGALAEMMPDGDYALESPDGTVVARKGLWTGKRPSRPGGADLPFLFAKQAVTFEGSDRKWNLWVGLTREGFFDRPGAKQVLAERRFLLVGIWALVLLVLVFGTFLMQRLARFRSVREKLQADIAERGRRLESLFGAVRGIVAESRKGGDSLSVEVGGGKENLERNVESISDIERSMDQLMTLAAEVTHLARSQMETSRDLTAQSVTSQGRLKGLQEVIARQAANITQMASAVEEMSATVRSIEQGTERSQKTVTVLAEGQKAGSALMQEVQSEMQSVASSVAAVRDFAELVVHVATQTNLLAMNASIEAAHAGEAGRGFSVVADEIRKLSDESGSQAEKARTALDHIQTTVAKAGKSVSALAVRFQELNGETETLVETVRMSTRAIIEHRGGNEEMLRSIKDVTLITEELMGAFEQLSGTVKNLLLAMPDMETRAESTSNRMGVLRESSERTQRSLQQMVVVMRDLDAVFGRVSGLTRENLDRLVTIETEMANSVGDDAARPRLLEG